MVAKEADAWAHATDEIIEPCGLARPVEAAPVSREHDARRRIVGEQQIETTFRDQPVDVLPRVMPLGVALKVLGPAPVVGRSVAPTDTAHKMPPRSNVEPLRR